MNKLLEKLIAVLLVITLAGANFIMLGTYGVAYALSDSEIAGQTTATGNENVEFNVYLEGGGHIATADAESEEMKIYLNIKVKNTGYLKNAEITFKDMNFKITGTIENENVQNVDLEKNIITLKQINNGSDVTIEIPITILNTEKVPVDNFSKESKTIFNGTYIDGEGKERNVSNEIVNRISWSEEAETSLEAELTKYIPYAKDEVYGVMVQTKITSGIENSKLPIKETNLEVTVPEIDGTKPSKVIVIANQTNATNGETDGLNFTSENYSYNTETGIVSILVKNEADENGQVSWKKNVQDEYLVTYIFEGKEIYNKANTNGIDSKVEVVAKIATYDANLTVLEKTVEHEAKATEKIGTIADFDISTTKEIAKGYIYASYDATEKKETLYTETYSVTVTLLELTDSIEFVQSHDKFVTEDGREGSTTVSNKNYAYNKSVRINENIFKKILGEDGSINLLNSDGETLATINKDTEKDSQGNYVLDISSYDNNALTIKTSKPVSAGTITLEVEKAIKGSIDYSKEQMQAFVKMKAEVVGKAATSTVTTSQEILLKEVNSVAGLEISKKDLTTVIKNENVEIRAILDTSSIYNALYTNPTLKITLPSHIEKIDINSTNILMDGGLKIKNVATNVENGSYVINIELEGMQTEYTIDAEYKGTIIILNTDITVKTLTPSNKNKITMEFTTENEVSTNKDGIVETEMNFVAPTGIVAANGISNYAEGETDIISISDQSVTGKIAANSEKRIATIYGKVINNYENAINNIVILGRMPVKDNKTIDGTENLGSTFSTILNSNITLEGIEESKYTVYYSENVDATTDLSNSNNGWTTTPTTGAKSYLIVTNNYEMAAGTMIEFTYNVEIPANLKHNNNVYTMYKVYYNNLSTIGEMVESKTSSIIALTTGEGPELTATLEPTIQTVREGQVIKMKVTVKNTGAMDASNVKVTIPVPEYASFVEYNVGVGFTEEKVDAKEILIPSIKVGQEKEEVYYIKIKEYTTSVIIDTDNTEEYDQIMEEENKFPKEITQKATITANELTGEIYSNECKLNVQDGGIVLEMNSVMPENKVLQKGETFEFLIDIRNIAMQESVNNVVVTIPLPTGFKYKSAVVKTGLISSEDTTDGITYNEQTKTVQVNIPKISSQMFISLNVEVEEHEGSLIMMAKATADGLEEHYSNVMEYMSEKVELEISELTSTPKYVKEEENVTYTLKLTNKGDATITNIEITDELPEGLSFVKATYMYAGEEQSIAYVEGRSIRIKIKLLEPGETTEVNIIAKADLLPDENDKEVKNSVNVEATNFEKVTTNIVSNVIEYNEELHKEEDETGEGEEPTTPTEKRYKITGTAWLDENKDGKRDSTESILSDIPIILINKHNNIIVRDIDTNQEKRTVTGSNGQYEFKNLPQGEYIVIFLYDAAKYSITEYRSQGIDESLNSDAVTINVTLDGERRVAGTSDAITISDDNVRDIDIGLYNAEKFDLRIDKYINKITLTTPTIGTKTYTYENSKAAKIEVLPQNLGKSNIAIEYKIVVTNEGAVAGYAKKVVDYLPEGVAFTTELNKDWYLSDNGNVYNASLENTVIKPGESKELTLLVTKKITEDSLDVLNNNAEIYETYNEQGISDIDSTAANKVKSEDDMSEADIALSIVTGEEIIMYVTLAIGVMTLLGLGIFIIKRKILKRAI